MKKLIFNLLLFILLISLVTADFTPQGDINLRGIYQIKNGTNITADYFFGDGGGLTGLNSSSINGSQLNVNSSTYWDDETSQADLNVNSSNYWDGLNTFNNSMFVQSGSTLNLLKSFLSGLFYLKNLLYNTTQIDIQHTDMNLTQSTDNSTQAAEITSLETRATNLETSNSSMDTRVDNMESSNTTQATAIALLRTDNTTQATAINARHIPGVCGDGTVVQNTTTGGVECIAAAVNTNTQWPINTTVLINQSGTLGIVKSWFTNLFYLITQIDSQHSDINLTQSNDNTTQSGEITAVENRATALETSNTSIDGRMDSAESSISTNSGDITNLETSNSSMDSRVDSAEGSITILQSDNTTQATAISLLRTDNTTQSNEINLRRLESWDNFSGVPHATPSNGDVTHFSWADEIYDWVIGLSYSTTVGTVTSVATDDTYLTGGAITTTGTITFNESRMNDTIDARSINTDTNTLWNLNASVLVNQSGVLGVVKSWWDGLYASLANFNTLNGQVTELESSNTTQANAITLLRTDNTTQATAIALLRTDNTTQSNLYYDRNESANFQELYLNISNINYKFTDANNNDLAIENVDSGQATALNLFTKDGDATDGVRINIYGKGVSEWLGDTNRERLQILWNPGADEYQIFTESSGGGVLKPLVLYTEGNANQTRLNTDGSVFMSGALTASSFIGPLTGTASLATSWASVSSFQAAWFSDAANVLTFNEVFLNSTIDARDTDTPPRDAGNGIALSVNTLSVAGNTALTQDSDGLSVTGNAIGDAQLQYDTGQALTNASNTMFASDNVTTGYYASGGSITHNGTHLIISG